MQVLVLGVVERSKLLLLFLGRLRCRGLRLRIAFLRLRGMLGGGGGRGGGEMLSILGGASVLVMPAGMIGFV